MHADACYMNHQISHRRQHVGRNNYIILEVLIMAVMYANAACYVNIMKFVMEVYLANTP